MMRTGPGLSYYERTWVWVNSSIEKEERSRKKKRKGIGKSNKQHERNMVAPFLNILIFQLPLNNVEKKKQEGIERNNPIDT